MALVLGTNCGFVTTAPTADPAGGLLSADTKCVGMRNTSPAGAIKVTEIGWWCDTASQAANFEVGIYTHESGNDEPDVLLAGESRTNAKGTTAGWKRVTGLNITISAETIYWIVFQLDDTSTATRTNQGSGSERFVLKNNQTTLPNPFNGFDGVTDALASIYAIAEVPTGVTRKIKISGTFQDKPIKTKVAGTFEDKPIKIKVGGTFQDA